uniref:Uncharacterized protein n=1 Tax=Setaria italica TaxID=4555 RepID=K3YDW2_SETIT
MNAKGKGSKKASGSNPRAKPTNWPIAISEFLLGWYIEKKLAMPPKTSFKKLHHTACTSAVNSNYGTTYSVDQVHRHWRRHRDTWGLVAKYLNESDPSTAVEEDDDGADKMDMMNAMSNYDEADDPQGQDSDKLESDSDECQEVAALAATASQVSSSNVQSMKPMG